MILLLIWNYLKLVVNISYFGFANLNWSLFRFYIYELKFLKKSCTNENVKKTLNHHESQEAQVIYNSNDIK